MKGCYCAVISKIKCVPVQAEAGLPLGWVLMHSHSTRLFGQFDHSNHHVFRTRIVSNEPRSLVSVCLSTVLISWKRRYTSPPAHRSKLIHGCHIDQPIKNSGFSDS